MLLLVENDDDGKHATVFLYSIRDFSVATVDDSRTVNTEAETSESRFKQLRRRILMNNKLIGVVLLAVGIVLLVMGYNASQSVGSQFKEVFSGSMSDKAMLFYLGGAVVTAVGAYLAFLSRK